MANEKGYRVEYVALSEIQRWPRNPKLHAEPDLDASLERFGFINPLILDEKTGKLVAGHGRLEALLRRRDAGKPPPERIATKGKEWMVPVVRGVTFKDAAEAEAYLLADNRLTEAGAWDDDALAKMLGRLSEADALAGTGYTPGDVEDLWARVASSQSALPEVPGGEAVTTAFAGGEIKQLVLAFPSAQYDVVVNRLTALMETMKVASHTEVVENLLAYQEAFS